MGKTSIEWCDRSINPIRARHRKTGAVGHYCELFSSGCAHCYASNFQKRFGMPSFPGKSRLSKLPVADERGCVIVSEDIELFLDESKLQEVLSRRKPCKWFWCDMTDLFGSWVPDEWIDRCFATMAATPQHTHQLLTKRAERLPDYVAHWITEGGESDEWQNPLRNVWLGASAENQIEAIKRHRSLMDVPAAVRFWSIEPLLGPIDALPLKNIHWVIVGGESGHGARPMHPDWVRSLRDQCEAAGVPFFFKQWGQWEPMTEPIEGLLAMSGKGMTLRCVEPDGTSGPSGGRGSVVVHRVGKKAAGRLLDGRTWDEFPSFETVQ